MEVFSVHVHDDNAIDVSFRWFVDFVESFVDVVGLESDCSEMSVFIVVEDFRDFKLLLVDENVFK